MRLNVTKDRGSRGWLLMALDKLFFDVVGALKSGCREISSKNNWSTFYGSIFTRGILARSSAGKPKNGHQ